MSKNIAQQLELNRSRCIELTEIIKRITTKNTKLSIGDAMDIAINYCQNDKEINFVYYIVGTLVGVSLEHENQLKFIDNLVDKLEENEDGTFIMDENFDPQLN